MLCRYICTWRGYCFGDDMAKVNVRYIIPQYEVQMNLDTPRVLEIKKKKKKRKIKKEGGKTCPINISCSLALFI